MCRDTFPRLVLYLCGGGLLCRLTVGAEIRPLCPPREGLRCREGEFTSLGGYAYKVDGRDVYINYVVGSYFEMQCDRASQSAEHPALPRFPEPVRVRTVTLTSCAPPAASYARTLAALNVSVTDSLKLHKVPGAPALRDDHFEGLTSLPSLDLRGTPPSAAPPARLPHAALATLPGLRNLTLQHVRLGTALETLPAELYSLQLWFTGVKFVALAGVPGLHQLSLREEDFVLVNVTGASALRSLDISSDSSSVAGVLHLPSLFHLGIDYWSETRPEPWQECGVLEHLSLLDSVSSQQTVLPGNWVSRCPVLSELSIRRVPLAPLPTRLLENATALKILKLTGCHLMELPSLLFNDSVQLISLDLSHNRLEVLPMNLFVPLRALKTLDLSNNLLTAKVAPTLQPLSSLKELVLVDNTRLSDLCDDAGASPLQWMTGLTKLVLRNTRVSRVCRDWREGMPRLKELDLTMTNITTLKYEDVMQRRSGPGASMKVGGRNNILRLEYSIQDYRRAHEELVDFGDVNIIMKAKIACDCNAYWAALAFRAGSRHARLHPPMCSGEKRSLWNVPLDELTCAAPELCSGLRGCSCVKRDDLLWPAGVATARCERRGLTTVPGPLPLGPLWHLMLANNNISSVQVSDLPPHLEELDLRHNVLEELEEDAAVELRTRKVHLEKNPLRCDCDALGLLELVTRPERIDLKNVTCAIESKLPSLKRMASDCAPPTSQPVALIAVLAAAVAAAALVVVAVLAKSETRLRIMILLEWIGWSARRRQEEAAGHEGDGRLFDAFVSYAHEDEEWVRATLVERLEGGSAPFRLCVHYRDWAPGEWIPAQIAASVRASRRTLAVVSRHFLKSDWARLEFREAHAQARRDVTPRLVVLLLEEAASLPLDAEMRAFIENNTYVRWGDPWFWKKLEHALPPRPRTSSAKAPQTERSQVQSPPPAAPKPPQPYCSAVPRPLVSRSSRNTCS